MTHVIGLGELLWCDAEPLYFHTTQHHRLPCRRVPVHGARIGSRGTALPDLRADARAMLEMQAPGARQQDGGALLRQGTQGC